MRAYKTICRLDFPVSFRLGDNLGRYAELLNARTDSAPFVRTATNVNFIERQVSGQLSIGEDKAQLHLSLSSFDFLVEFKAGHKLGDVHKHPIVALADEFFRQVADAGVRRIERIGVRHWVLVEHEKLRFEGVRSYIAGYLTSVADAVTSAFSELQDVAITFEARADDSTCTRVVLGPYREAERQRYFSSAAEAVRHALIVDIDVWQTKLELPSVSVASGVKAFERSAMRVVERLATNILEAVHG